MKATLHRLYCEDSFKQDLVEHVEVTAMDNSRLKDSVARQIFRALLPMNCRSQIDSSKYDEASKTLVKIKVCNTFACTQPRLVWVAMFLPY